MWWQEALLIGVGYGAYALTRASLARRETTARANALALYDAERDLHLDLDARINHAFATDAPHWLSVVGNYAYSIAHLSVTAAVLVWLYVSHEHIYRSSRSILLCTTGIGLLTFWLYPMAPPRLFPELGFVDTVVRDQTWGSWGSSSVTALSNQLAAMPSIHQAWSLWCAANLLLLARQPLVRAAAVGYPAVVFVVILGTGNHWTLDAPAGLAALGLGAAAYVAAARLTGLAGERWRRAPAFRSSSHTG